MTTDARLHSGAIKALEFGPDVQRALDKLGAAIAADARVLAPKRTGAMAASIRHEVGTDSESAYVRISFDRDHFYGAFAELGTSQQSPQPFLRPALTKRRSNI